MYAFRALDANHQRPKIRRRTMERKALIFVVCCLSGTGCKNSPGTSVTITKTVTVTVADTDTNTQVATSTPTATATATATAVQPDAGLIAPAVTCGTASQDAGIALNCPPGQVIVAVNFASYGNPTGACPAGTSGTLVVTNVDASSAGNDAGIMPSTAIDAADDIASIDQAAVDAGKSEAGKAPIDAGAYDASRPDVPQAALGKDASIADVAIAKAIDGGNAAFAIGSCNAVNSFATAETLCLGKNSCTIGADNASFGGDPCPTTAKSAAVQVACGALTEAKSCGQAYQKPCGDYTIVLVSISTKSPLDRTKLRCDPGVRLDNVIVMVNNTDTIGNIPWCVPCNWSSSTVKYATSCANLNLFDPSYTSCVAYPTARAASAAEICDGIDNDCNGMIDDGAAVSSCLKQGAGYKCLPIDSSTAYASSCQCVPDCSANVCGGSDGCGGICKTGSCASGVCQQASAGTYSCVCTPNCSQAKCGGSDGCGKTCTGTCQSGASCYLNNFSSYVCSDTNVCTGVACGALGGAGIPCSGTCPTGNNCSRQASAGGATAAPTYACVCVPSCPANSCGAADGCGGTCKYCSAAGSSCVQSSGVWSCCTPACTGKTCGASNGCGGTCASGSGCTTPCTPSCAGKTCGDNGCGGSCGTCTDALDTCVSGVCKQTLCYTSGGYCTSDAQCCTSQGVYCCLGSHYGSGANTCNCIGIEG
jgi:hypothetical protein